MTGVVGRITWAYYTAAAINGYTVTRGGTKADPQWSMTATVVTSDAFKLSQRPLFFVAPHAKGEWRWPIETLDVSANGGPKHIRATLGSPL